MHSEHQKLLAELRGSEDAEFIDIWRRCSPFTMTSVERGLALYRSVKYLVDQRVPGIFVECGLWRGGSVMIAMLTLRALQAGTRHFVLFDTFDGMTEPGIHDFDNQGVHASEYLAGDAQDPQTQLVQARATRDEVLSNLESTGYDLDAIRLIEGDVRKKIPSANLPPISLLRLDTDFYDSTYVELMYLYPRLVQSGVLIVDDYGHWQGARKAVDDYFSGGGPAPAPRPPRPFFQRIDYTGRLAVRTDFSDGTIPEELSVANRRRRPLMAASGRLVPEIADRYDYVPPNLHDPQLLPAFPSLQVGEVRRNKWPFLRQDAPHRWRFDTRSRDKNVGVLSVEEAIVLHNLAKQFGGKRGLVIGCHYAWSTAHILSAGVQLDIVDPALHRREQMAGVIESLNKAVPGSDYKLWAAYSPTVLSGLHERIAAGAGWSFVFIDGDHEGDAPERDAIAVLDKCAEKAMVVLHDLVAPDVLAGWQVFRDAGWQTQILNTMQIMGIAWRGNCQTVPHVADPQMPPLPDYVAEHMSAKSGEIG